MKTSGQRLPFCRSILAVALAAGFAAAHAADDASSAPDSIVSVGIGAQTGSSKDRALFGQYNGMRDNRGELLLNGIMQKRDEETGTWVTIQGRNLGLDNRDFGASYQQQGDWKVSVDYSELVRREPRTVNTALQGAGTTTPTATLLPAAGTGSELNLQTKRQGVSVAGEKWLTPDLLLELSFTNEKKDGARLWGRGIACGVFAFANNTCGTGVAPLAATAGAILMLPEPINSTSRQLEAKLNYSGERLKLSGGYYGSFYNNANNALTPSVVGSLSTPNGTLFVPGAVPVNTNGPDTLLSVLQQPMALPPDNQAHQLGLSGSYAFTPATRSTFKLAYTHATQSQDFTNFGAPAGFTNLGGVVNSTLAQLGLTSRPTTNLSLNANMRYEDRDDKTPYNALNPYTVAQNSWNKVTGKLEASYRLPDNYRATVGADYQAVSRDLPVGTLLPADPGFSGVREQTRETGYRAELRRTMSETLNATIGYGSSRRTGSGWLTNGYTANTAAAPGTFPVTKADRNRDKLKFAADWAPSEAVSLQFLVEDGKDRYTMPSDAGLRDTGMRNYGIDAVWKLSDAWKLTGYWNQAEQTLHVNHLPLPGGYMAELKDLSTNLSFGAVGVLSPKVEIGGNLMFLNDNNRYQLSPATLPDATYRVSALRLYGKYSLEKDSDVRVDLLHQRAKLDEWSWMYNGVPFAYSDNTTVAMQQNQNVTFIGATYIYRMK